MTVLRLAPEPFTSCDFRLRRAVSCFYRPVVIMSFFSSRGWESWDIANRPLIPERMPVLVDDDLLFEDGSGDPRPSVAVNQSLRSCPPAVPRRRPRGRRTRSTVIQDDDVGAGSRHWCGGCGGGSPSGLSFFVCDGTVITSEMGAGLWCGPPRDLLAKPRGGPLGDARRRRAHGKR